MLIPTIAPSLKVIRPPPFRFWTSWRSLRPLLVNANSVLAVPSSRLKSAAALRNGSARRPSILNCWRTAGTPFSMATRSVPLPCPP
jgi:hypothetical protein